MDTWGRSRPFAAALVVTSVMGAGVAQIALAQSSYFAYPKAGQDQEKQSFDNFECHQWSVQQTGFDPTKPSEPVPQAYATSPPPSTNRGGLLRGAARGAALGAVGGAVAGDAGKGAAVGAAVGALGGTMRRQQAYREREQWEAQQRQQQQQMQQQAEQQRAQQQQAYDRAWSACMTARNYQVQ